MKRKYLLSVLLVAASMTAFSKVWKVGNSGNTFSPSAITIKAGDTVRFDIESNHNAVEVSKATWDANGSSILIGGFGTSFGGGDVYPAQLTVGTHYYVCTPHASMGMKGTIIVQSVSTGISDNYVLPEISLFPNPSEGRFRVTLNGTFIAGQSHVEVFNLAGKSVFRSELENAQTDLDLSDQAKGVYLLRLDLGSAIQTRKIIIQ